MSCCIKEGIDLDDPGERARFALRAYQWVSKEQRGCANVAQASCGEMILGLLYLCGDEGWDFDDMVRTAQMFVESRRQEAASEWPSP